VCVRVVSVCVILCESKKIACTRVLCLSDIFLLFNFHMVYEQPTLWYTCDCGKENNKYKILSI
jgi:hypothetical protein